MNASESRDQKKLVERDLAILVRIEEPKCEFGDLLRMAVVVELLIDLYELIFG